jgi:agmatinase
MKNNFYKGNTISFGGLPEQDFEKAKIVVIPVPYEATTSYKEGTKRGPKAILEASGQLEEIWGEFVHSKIEKEKLIFTTKEIKLKGKSEKTFLALSNFLKGIFDKKKIPFILGGEHSITFGAVKEAKKHFKNLSVLQFDAHTDLRDTYLKEKFSHACTMRRIRELGVPTVSCGIRSIDCDVADFIKKKKIKNIFFPPELPSNKILKSLSKNVYLTFDFDFFDPSIMPSVGTPQPGGHLWQETIDLLQKICKKKNIVGADFVELCPTPGFIAPDFLAAKLIYKIITFIL